MLHTFSRVEDGVGIKTQSEAFTSFSGPSGKRLLQSTEEPLLTGIENRMCVIFAVGIKTTGKLLKQHFHVACLKSSAEYIVWCELSITKNNPTTLIVGEAFTVSPCQKEAT